MRNLSHLTTPLSLLQVFTLPSDMDWSQFDTDITLASYLDYMQRMHKIDSVIPFFLKYIKRFDRENRSSFDGYRIPYLYGLIRGRGGRRRGDLIGQFCSMLANDKKKSGYVEQMAVWTDEEKKDAMKCLKILFSNVYGMEMTPNNGWLDPSVSTGRKMRELWIKEGETEEGRREWEWRWREAGDIMVEEDLIEIFYLSLCIKTAVEDKEMAYNILSERSLIALSALRCKGIGYPFILCPLSSIPNDSVVVRFTHWQGDMPEQYTKYVIVSMLDREFEREKGERLHRYYPCTDAPYIVLTLRNRKAARMLVEKMNGRRIDRVRISMSQGTQTLLKRIATRLFS